MCLDVCNGTPAGVLNVQLGQVQIRIHIPVRVDLASPSDHGFFSPLTLWMRLGAHQFHLPSSDIMAGTR